jgi:hypothetical protein
MFSQLLLKSFQIGDKLFHVLSHPGINVDEWEKLGIEIIKYDDVIKKQLEQKSAQSQQEAEEKVNPEA